MRLGDAERDAFVERGVLRLPGALGHAEARRMAGREEIIADPGDVVLLHPRTFHAPAPNCGRVPRFAVSHSLFRP